MALNDDGNKNGRATAKILGLTIPQLSKLIASIILMVAGGYVAVETQGSSPPADGLALERDRLNQAIARYQAFEDELQSLQLLTRSHTERIDALRADVLRNEQDIRYWRQRTDTRDRSLLAPDTRGRN